MEQNMEYRKQLIQKYRADVEPLLEFLPWFETKSGQTTSYQYKDERFSEHSLSFPVYDSTLMKFIKAVEKTSLLDRNYVYVYSRNRLQTPEDERALIAKADLWDAKNLNGILSRYIMGGRTKGWLWTLGVQEDIYLLLLKKWKEILDIWDGPLA